MRRAPFVSRLLAPLTLVTVTLVSSASLAFSQGVGINSTGAAADTSAILDLSATNKGFLPPRMSTIQRNTIVLPATGLVIYQTDGVQGLYFNAGTPAAPNWKQVADAGGGSGQWSTSGTNLYYTAGKVGVGTSTFDAGLTVSDPLNGLRVATTGSGGAVASFGGSGAFRVDAPGVIGGRFQLLENGYLGLGRTAPLARLDMQGGNWDVVNGEGDFRIGDANTRLKIGIATAGGGTGSASIMEQGPSGAYNVLSLGTQGNKVLHVNGVTQSVGIGTDSPNAPLGFPAVLGKKITLYPGGGGDVGIGVAGNRLQLYGDYPNADVALGQDQAGTFIERFAVKPTGALAVNGNVGSGGQVLQSNGAGSAATWVSPTNAAFNNTYMVTSQNSGTWTNSTPLNQPIPDLTQTFTTASTAKVLVSWTFNEQSTSCFACGSTYVWYYLELDGVRTNSFESYVGNGEGQTMTGTYPLVVAPGTHTVLLKVGYTTGNTMTIGSRGTSVWQSSFTTQVFPQ